MASPEYVAVIVCEPTDNVDKERITLPGSILTSDLVIPSIVNSTVPVGVGEPEEDKTVAVNVIDCPYGDEFVLDLRVVDVGLVPIDTVSGQPSVSWYPLIVSASLGHLSRLSGIPSLSESVG